MKEWRGSEKVDMKLRNCEAEIFIKRGRLEGGILVGRFEAGTFINDWRMQSEMLVGRVEREAFVKREQGIL
jgi:hypothetical protein